MRYQPKPITFKTLPASAGIYWIIRGLKLLNRKPLSILYAVMVMQMIDLILSTLIIPDIGLFISGMITPALHLGLMGIIAVRVMPETQTTLQQLFMIFKMRGLLQRLCVLGAIYIFSLTLMMWLINTYIIPNTINQLTTLFESLFTEINRINNTDNIDTTQATIHTILNQSKYTPMKELIIHAAQVFIPLMLFIQLMFWYTQQLVGWHGQSIPKALFFNMMACWRNRYPFIVYLMTWGALIYLGLILMGLIISLNPMMVLIVLPMFMWFLSWIMCSAYATYESTIDIIEIND